MGPRAPDWSFRRVVVVADGFDPAASDAPVDHRRDLEMSDAETLKTLLDALAELGLESVHYTGPSFLALNAAEHRNDIVLSLYGGSRSRSRMTLVPAMCEAPAHSVCRP